MRTRPLLGRLGAALSLAALTLGGCGVRRSLERIQRIAPQVELHAGTARPAERGKGPVVVVALEDARGKRPLAAAVAMQPGDTFQMVAPAGAKYLLAFVDENDDLRWRPPEPAVLVPAQPVDLSAPAGRRGLEITVNGGSAPKGLAEVNAAELLRAVSASTAEHRVGGTGSLEAPQYGPDGIKVGMWDPLTFYRWFGPSLVLLEPYDPSRIPVLFVHGAAASPRDFEELIPRLDRKRFQAWVFQYASGASIRLSAAILDRALGAMEARYRPAHLYLVAHSMGGLVSRRMFLDRAESGRPLGVEKFLTLSTPWEGNAGAGLGVRMSPVVADMWRDMDPNGDLVGGLFDRSLSDALCYGLMFGFGGNHRVLSAANDGTVTLESALRPSAQLEARFVRGFNVSHEGILTDPKAALAVEEFLKDDTICARIPAGQSARR